MTLTHPKFEQINSNLTDIDDPQVILNGASTSANVDIGVIFNRDSGSSSNVALYWSETQKSVITAFTSNSGLTNSNIVVRSYTDLTTGNVNAANVFVGGSVYSSQNLTYFLNPSQGSVLNSVTLNSAVENVQLIGTPPASSQTVHPSSGSVIFFTTSATNNWTLNITYSATETLGTQLAVGQAMTLAVLTTQGATAYYNTAVQIDGTTVTPQWQGSAPAAGNPLGVDIYGYLIIKTSSTPTFSVFAAVNGFA
jgi:hypothetical protein